MKQPVKFGKYYLLERINVGGMAEVFKAKSFGVEGFEKLLAIKRILPNIAEDEDFITMFIDEAKIAVQLNHANIAQIFDLGKIDDSFFIALEFVHGKDLRTIWERHKRRGLRMPIPMSVYVVSRVCEGLDYAHRKKDAAGRNLNIVHRDVSPQNILLSYEGEIKIIDFGIAKAANKASKTQAGILKGKFGYMSPEQVRGLPLDRRSDVFSAGIILYELLTGERLFVGESDFSTLEKVRNVEILPPTTYNRNIPDSLEKIVLRALSKDPDDRFQSAYDMQEELQRFLILSKANFARKDLSAYMKRAFRSDIERELERHKQYESLTAPPGGSFLQEAEPEVPTSKMTPPRIDQMAFDTGEEDDEDDEVETVVWDARSGLPEEEPTDPVEAKQKIPPPRSRPEVDDSRPLAPPKRPPPLHREQMPAEEPEDPNILEEAVEDSEEMALDTVTNSTPDAGSPVSLDDDPYLTGEATLAEESPVTKQRSKVNLLIAGLAILAIGLFGFAVFKYLQQQGLLGGGATLLIQSTPPNADLWLDGKKVGSRVEEVKPGTHVLEAKADNYNPYEEQISVSAGEEKKIAISLTFVPAVIEITVEPPGVVVKMDGKKVGDKSPVRLEDVLPGVSHTFAFEHANYKPRTETWTLKPREVRKEKVVLEEILFELDVDTTPSGARVFLDDKLLGRSPEVVKDLKATKQYRLEIKKRGYETWSTTVFYDGTQTKVIRKRLESLSGQPAPEPRGPVKKPKEATQIRKPRKPRPEKPKTKPSPGASAKEMGTLRLNSKPWGKVIINGEDTGQNTPLPNYKLPAGAYTVTIQFVNGGSKTAKVDIFPGQVTKKIMRKE